MATRALAKGFSSVTLYSDRGGTGHILEIKDNTDGPTDYFIFYLLNLPILSDIFKEIIIT